MENQELEDGKFDINEKEIKKLLEKTSKQFVINEYEKVFNLLKSDIIDNDTIQEPYLVKVLEGVLISIKDELSNPLLKGNEKIYKKYEYDRLNGICKAIKNDIERKQIIMQLNEKETEILKIDSIDQLQQTTVKDQTKDLNKPKSIDVILFVAVARKLKLFYPDDEKTNKERTDFLIHELQTNSKFEKIKLKTELNFETIVRNVKRLINDKDTYFIKNEEKIAEILKLIESD